MTDEKQQKEQNEDELRDLNVPETDAEGVKGGMQESQKMQEMNMSLKPPVPGAPTARP